MTDENEVEPPRHAGAAVLGLNMGSSTKAPYFATALEPIAADTLPDHEMIPSLRSRMRSCKREIECMRNGWIGFAF